MKKFVLSMGVALLSILSVPAQTTMRGQVFSKSTDDKVNVLPFAGIALYLQSDTAKLVKSSVSDQKGNFVVEGISKGKYLIKVSFIGYLTVADTLTVATDASQTISKRYELKENVRSLAEVTVTQQQSFMKREKRIELFSADQMKASHDGLDLVSKVPHLYLDSQSKSLKDISGNSLVILINGIAATNEQLRSIPADKILRVEYYDIPPVRYAEAGRVIDVITKRLDNGHSGGFDLTHAFTTGFANDQLYYNYVSGNHQLSFNYSLNWRDYRHSDTSQLYDFSLDNKRYIYDSNDSGKFGYTVNNINLMYTYNKPGKLTFQLKASPNFNTDHSTYHSLYDVKAAGMESTRYGLKKDHSNYFSPVVGAYTNITLAPKSQLYIDLVGTWYNTKQNSENNQYSDEVLTQTVLENYLHSKTHKKSFIGEVMYQKDFNHGNSLSLGFKSAFDRSSSDIRNILNGGEPYHYFTQSSNQKIYAQYTQSLGKFYYMLRTSGNFHFIKNSENRYRKFELIPSVVLNYQPNTKHELQVMGWIERNSPGISTMTKTASLTMDNLIYYGNPNIQPSTAYNAYLGYSFTSKHFYIDFAPTYTKTNNIITQYYQADLYNGKPVMARRWENAKYLEETNLLSNIILYPLADRSLSIRSHFGYIHSKYKSNYMDVFEHDFLDLFFVVAYNKQKYGMQATYRVPGTYFKPIYTSKMENNSSLTAYYNLGNWRFTAAWMFWFTPSKYSGDSMRGSLVTDKWRSSIRDNKNMFTVGISWNFRTGKSIQVNKKLDNRDSDSGKI